MEIIKRMQQGTYDVKLVGNFTFSDHTAFRGVLKEIDEKDVHHIVLNMEDLEFVDSAALGMLLLALDAVERNQKRLLICGATGQVKRMFDLARFHTLFAMS